MEPLRQQPLILLADDESYVTTVVGHQLQRRGYEVIVAGDGQEAIALCEERHPKLIISDFQMPVVSGLEMAMHLRKQPGTCDIPVIMLTARGHRLEHSELTQTNIRCLLAKPFSIKELLAQVEELVAPGPTSEASSPPAEAV